MAEDSPTQATLLAAVDVILTHGWCRYDSKLPTGEVCLEGALLSAAGAEWVAVDPNFDPNPDTPLLIEPGSVDIHRYETARRVVRRRLEDRRELWQSLTGWNDAAAATSDDVIRLLKEAAEDA